MMIIIIPSYNNLIIDTIIQRPILILNFQIIPTDDNSMMIR